MKLLTKEIENSIPKLYSQEKNDNPDVYVKFFTPWTCWTWYATEGQRTETGDFEFFGYVCGLEKEWGYFMLSELESINGPWGLKVERDKFFSRCPIKSLKDYKGGEDE